MCLAIVVCVFCTCEDQERKWSISTPSSLSPFTTCKFLASLFAPLVGSLVATLVAPLFAPLVGPIVVRLIAPLVWPSVALIAALLAAFAFAFALICGRGHCTWSTPFDLTSLTSLRSSFISARIALHSDSM